MQHLVASPASYRESQASWSAREGEPNAPSGKALPSKVTPSKEQRAARELKTNVVLHAEPASKSRSLTPSFLKRREEGEDHSEWATGEGVSISDAALAHVLAIHRAKKTNSAARKRAASFGQDITPKQPIPWYIIDPTGELLPHQREDEAAKRKIDRLEDFLRRLPTLQPTWDLLTGFALIFTALITPFEVGFLPPSTKASDPLFVINRVIDVIFVLDMVFQFFTMKEVDVEKATQSQLQWEMDLRVLARDYLLSWFAIDVASIAPSALDFLPVIWAAENGAQEEGENVEQGQGLRIFRTLRALRLIKLMRLVKTSRVIARLMDYVSLSCTAQEVVSTAVQAMVLTHWYACVLMITTILFADSPLETWLATYGFCAPDGQVLDDVGFLYLKTWKWSLGLIFHNSLPVEPDYGPYEPHYADVNEFKQQLRMSEEVVYILLKIGGIGFWSLAVSKIIRSVTMLGNPALIAYSQDLDSVNRFCGYNRLPSWLGRELRRYVRKTREVHEQRTRNDIYSKLSPLLVVKVTKLLNRTLVESRFVQQALTQLTPLEGERFVASLVTAATTAVFSPGDRPPSRRLYIITEGVALHDTMKLIGIGDCWGDENVLLGLQAALWMREVRAITYLRVIYISRRDFLQLEDEFPQAFKALRASAIWKRARRILREAMREPETVAQLLAELSKEESIGGDGGMPTSEELS